MVLQADDTKSSRFYITGFNIDVDFVKNIVISKANSAGKFNINYMYAAVNKEAYAGEIFIEIDGTIRVRTLMAQLEEMGACQVSVLTFKNNDGNESASNALLRVWTAAEKTGHEYTCGIPSKDLWGKAKTKQDAEKQQKTDNEKNEAKLNEGVRQSLAAMGEKVANVGGKVEHMDKKVDTMEVKIESVQQGVCTIIPDYQKLLKDTMEKLAHKTKEVDRIEYRMGLMTREINKITEENETIKESTKITLRKHEREIAELTDALVTKDKQIKDKEELLESYRMFETAKWIIETERDIKRARM